MTKDFSSDIIDSQSFIFANYLIFLHVFYDEPKYFFSLSNYFISIKLILIIIFSNKIIIKINGSNY
jgi:hypothetical protein